MLDVETQIRKTVYSAVTPGQNGHLCGHDAFKFILLTETSILIQISMLFGLMHPFGNKPESFLNRLLTMQKIK